METTYLGKNKYKILYENGDIYTGTLKNSVYNGNGTLNSFDNIYQFQGRWKNNQKQGHGKLTIALDHLVSLGGEFQTEGSTPINDFFMFSIENGWKKTKFPHMNFRRCVFAAITIDHYIYVIGGYNGKFASSNVERFDFLTQKWTELSPLIYRRSSCSAVYNQNVENPCIYVAGGVTHDTISLIEQYSVKTNTWKGIGNLKHPRSGCSLTFYNDKLFIIGGVNKTTSLPVEIFNVVTKEHVILENVTNLEYSSASIFTFYENKPFIFLLGGIDKEHKIVSDKMLGFDIDNLKFIDFPPMNHARHYCSVFLKNEKLHVIGGYDGDKIVSSVDIFDFETKSWTLETIDYPYCGSCVLFLNKNIHLETCWKENKLEGKYNLNQSIYGKFKNGKKNGNEYKNDSIIRYYIEDIPICPHQEKINKKLKKISIPSHFLCPISFEIMKNPVITKEGITYERDEIQKWLQKNETDPVTRQKIPNELIPNVLIRKLIYEFLEKKKLM